MPIIHLSDIFPCLRKHWIITFLVFIDYERQALSNKNSQCRYFDELFNLNFILETESQYFISIYSMYSILFVHH